MHDDTIDAIARWLGSEVVPDPVQRSKAFAEYLDASADVAAAAPAELVPLLRYRQEEALADVLAEFYGGRPDDHREPANDLIFFLNANGYVIAQGTVDPD